jgi:flagellar protein FliO/FliZ
MRHILQSLFGLDLSTAQKVIVASVVILILLVLLGLFVRQIQGGRLKMKGQGGGRARQPRLGVVDAHNLDRQRQLILIRRDNVEHLIMIGGASDVVVETNILRSGARAAPQPLDFAASERPQAFESLVPPEPVRQEPARQEPARQEPARQEPVRQEPVVVAQPRPDLLPPLPMRQTQAAPPSRPVQTQTQADAALAAAAAVAAPAAFTAMASAASSNVSATPSPTPNVAPPSFSRDHAPSPTASAVELDSMARQLEEALKRPFSAVRPANSPGEPPATVIPVPSPDVAPAEPRAAEVPPTPVEHLPMPTPPAPPETSGRPVSLPADVEAELELALGLKPTRAAPSSPDLTPVEDAVDEEPEQLEADDLTLDVSEPDEPPAKPLSDPEDKALQVELAPAAAEAKVPAKEPEPEQKPAVIDPFSVDAIEAEFARLLGRDPKAKS